MKVLIAFPFVSKNNNMVTMRMRNNQVVHDYRRYRRSSVAVCCITGLFLAVCNILHAMSSQIIMVDSSTFGSGSGSTTTTTTTASPIQQLHDDYDYDYDEDTLALIQNWDWSNVTTDESSSSSSSSSSLFNLETTKAKLFHPGNLPFELVMSAIDLFKDGQYPMHPEYVTRILDQSFELFHSRPNVDTIELVSSLPKHNNNNYHSKNATTTTTDNDNENDDDYDYSSHTPRQITICGDIHGKFYDLLQIFELNGYPSLQNPYLFNGDMVDRGAYGIETILTLFLFQLHCGWDCLHLNRGNHEFTKPAYSESTLQRELNWQYQVETLYDATMYQHFVRVFRQLPFVHILQDKIFISHAGLTNRIPDNHDDTDGFAKIATVEELRQHIPKGVGGPSSYTWWSNLIWSSPMDHQDGLIGTNPKKVKRGMKFGPNETMHFLRRNNLTHIIRSHDCFGENGFEMTHDNRVLTIFSSPSMCKGGGKGGSSSRHHNASILRVGYDIDDDNDKNDSGSSAQLKVRIKSFGAAPEPPQDATLVRKLSRIKTMKD